MLFDLLQNLSPAAILGIAAGGALLLAAILSFLALLIADRFAFGMSKNPPSWVTAIVLLPAALLLIPGPQWMIGWMTTAYSPALLIALLPFGVLSLAKAMRITISPRLRQSASIDGLPRNETLFKIILPLIRSTFAAFFLLVFVAGWNLFVGSGSGGEQVAPVIFGVALVGSVVFLSLLQQDTPRLPSCTFPC